MIIPSVPPDLETLKDYFRGQGLDAVVEAANKPQPAVNEMILDTPYRPELGDLYRLHKFIVDNRRTTVLEFGVGWSTYVMAHAMSLNNREHCESVKDLRRNNPFEVHSVDNEQRFIEIAAARIPEDLSLHTYITYAAVSMVSFQGRYATEYETLPLVNPDFIYLDGPDQFNIVNDIAGFSTAHKDMMPMSCDILKFEHFLTPGTIIVVDGRAANARFLRANLQRGWSYKHDSECDQHLFLLSEEPLGKYNRKQIEFYSN